MILNKNINAKSSITLLKVKNNNIIDGIDSNYSFYYYDNIDFLVDN